MKSFSLWLLPALLPLLFQLNCQAKERLRSPWDLHPVAATDVAYTCPQPAQLPRSFAADSYYVDKRHSIPDPALKKRYEDSVSGINDFSRDVVAAADKFQTTGSRPAAQCLLTLLESAAKEGALSGSMDTGQASYVQGWNLGAWAVGYLKVRESGAVTSDQEKTILPWFKKLASANRDYYEMKRNKRRPNDSDNNHVYWAGFAISAAGIASDDDKLFKWGLDAYKHGVHDIDRDGTLPNELARGQMAVHYHLYALAPLIMIAEFAEANGIDLYAERDYAIKRLVARCVDSLQSPDYIQKRTGVAQVADSQIEAWQISWAQPYVRRFPDPKISELMAKADRLNYTTLGGLPPP